MGNRPDRGKGHRKKKAKEDSAERLQGGIIKGVTWYLGDMQEVRRFRVVASFTNISSMLNSIGNAQARVFLSIYSLTLGGDLGLMVNIDLISKMSGVLKSHCWRYIRDLERLGFIGSTASKFSVVVDYPNGDKEEITGRIVWIEDRGKIDEDETGKEEGYKSKRKCNERDKINEKVKEISVFSRKDSQDN